MRLIDADDLIAKLGDWYTQGLHTSGREPSREESPEKVFLEVIKDIVEHMPTIAVEWRWIPIEEKHPNETDWYLVTLDDGRHSIRWYSSLHGWERIAGNDVISWLPHPDPYRVFAQIVDLYSGS